ncbi:MAG: type II toxin-antitoxin system VapC family toxin [Candidatus Brocadiia bacterium]
MAYIDTSVLVAYYCPEPLSALAQEAIERAETPTVNPLIEVEFCSALAIKVRTGELEAESAERVLGRFRQHLEEDCYRIIPIETREYLLAADWLSRFSTPLRTVDALHLASAFTVGLRLLTADRALARSAEHFGVECDLVS